LRVNAATIGFTNEAKEKPRQNGMDFLKGLWAREKRARPWLFEIFAELDKHLPWTSLVSAPTRVEKLETVSA